jgi:cystathionine beta-lyase/cystathionine gamma-synthase
MSDRDARDGRTPPRPDLHPSGAVSFPIFQAATYAFPDTAGIEAYHEDPTSHYFYSRYANPTCDACARALAALEGGEDALLFSSGMGAISSAVASFVRSGDQILSMSDVYGGTLRLFQDLLPRFGVGVAWFGAADAVSAIRAATPSTRVVYLESPTNPTLEVVDLAAAARAARERGLVTLIDGTFASPMNQKPLALGIDVVIHSATKYLGGHSDLTAGAVVSSREHIARIHATMKVLGSNLDPFAAFLVHRGLRTLELRVRRQCDSALRIAQFLAGHPRVRRAIYPGLSTHPGHEVARRQMAGFGGIVTFEVEGGLEGARRVVDRLRVVLNAPSLGSVDSLVSIPVLTSHEGFSAEALARAGVTEGMVRLSVGVEPVEDLLADLERALSG